MWGVQAAEPAAGETRELVSKVRVPGVDRLFEQGRSRAPVPAREGHARNGHTLIPESEMSSIRILISVQLSVIGLDKSARQQEAFKGPAPASR